MGYERAWESLGTCRGTLAREDHRDGVAVDIVVVPWVNVLIDADKKRRRNVSESLLSW